MRIEILGAVRALGPHGAVDLRGSRQREVLARLVLARGAAVDAAQLLEDLWEEAPPTGLGSLRTFVGTLRSALSEAGAAGGRNGAIVTEGPAYRLNLLEAEVDLRIAEQARVQLPHSVDTARDVLDRWRGDALLDLPDRPWVVDARRRLAALRLDLVEQWARATLRDGSAASVIQELQRHTAAQPWREAGWVLLAEALQASDRRVEALQVVREARSMLVDELGLDPGQNLRRVEERILRSDDDPGPERGVLAAQWSLGPLRSAALSSSLSIAGGAALVAARRERLAAIRAAERTGDVDLVARVIGAYDVPALWSRSDDVAQAREVVAAARRTLSRLPPDAAPARRARLLATIAIETRGVDDPAARASAAEAARLAHAEADPVLRAFTVNGLYMQSFDRVGRAADRALLGRELIRGTEAGVAPAFAILGHLIALQSAAAEGDAPSAADHAAAAEALAETTDAPLVPVLTAWWRASSLAVDDPRGAERAYRAAETAMATSGMTGMHDGLLALSLLGLSLLHARPAPLDPDLDWGRFRPWAEPHLLLAVGETARARSALTAVPSPAPDHLQEALWCVIADAATRMDDFAQLQRARRALAAASHEVAAGSGVMTFGPVQRYLGGSSLS